jgi:hypothetical protein
LSLERQFVKFPLIVSVLLRLLVNILNVLSDSVLIYDFQVRYLLIRMAPMRQPELIYGDGLFIVVLRDAEFYDGWLMANLTLLFKALLAR